MANATVRRRRDQPDRVQHGTATDGENVGMAVDVVVEKGLLNGLDKMQVGFNFFTAGHRDRVRNQIKFAYVMRRIGLDILDQFGRLD